ncbi:DUF4259 domain-containing protein [Catellatospora coxensis]|uniref:DUF4259 domain-containing protein n=1 Tax=Catellatospora coxensis TaxID=310354 RepID=A0A8J3KN01_9ACTN|nr:DUF4259 domain-containing protein [Catellatospora coxensis]GIG04055.1 hypothetical protein Cco03nite_07550 [Catellatospora coxensis]
MVGTWDSGPFDNDSAADWCGGLNDADPAERLGIIRQTLAEVADHVGFLDDRLGVRAVAAAAVIVSQRPGAEALTSAYAPDFLVEGEALVVPEDVAALAVRALDRVVGDDSEWRELWEETGDAADALAVVGDLRTALAAAP